MSGSKTALSVGAGLNFLHINFDISATVTPGSETIKAPASQKMPSEAAISAQFAFCSAAEP